ncbi:MAG: hypothetical protein LBL31_03565 [Spirochaetaceae bacterium]|jgi:hypothetical protein|nr:hypothetical protein [Spirochaetaceae bacterium]
MKYKSIALTVVAFILLCSCNNKNITESDILAVDKDNEYLKNAFDEINKDHLPVQLPIEYYRDIILWDNSSRGYIELLEITRLEYFVPGYLSFIAYWRTGEGYVYKLYTFTLVENQQIIAEIYNLNNGWPSPYTKILMEKIPGKRFGDYLTIVDINDDGFNEIIAFSFGGFGNLFAIYGFDVMASRITKYCEIEYYFNYDEPFPPVEFRKDKIRILEIVDRESYDLAWIEYRWNVTEGKYTKE